MSNVKPTPLVNAVQPSAPTPERTLRRLFLTLFLRGHTSRGLQKDKSPKSVGEKLAWTLLLYALIGLLALTFVTQPLFFLSAYLHAMTFVFLGMFVASSSGEMLFNKEEADILLHRPVLPKDLLRAKVRILIEVSLWLALAFNFVGLFVGFAGPQGSYLFPVVHLASTTLQAIFCTGCVILVYEICLRWFGRERLENLMTMAQVIMSLAAVLSGQLLPQLLIRFDKLGAAVEPGWWMGLFPPVWFACLDDALVGTGASKSWFLAALGLLCTLLIVWLAFGKLAVDYEAGVKRLGESAAPQPSIHRTRRWLDSLTSLPPWRWWLRDPVTRASFLLTSAYLLRDRDVKLRVYPALAPFLVMPLVLLLPSLQGHADSNAFGTAFAGAYIAIIPVFGLTILQYSQQWQAAEVLRGAPLVGPAKICHGARKAVLSFIALPILTLFGLLLIVAQRELSQLLLLLPGIIALPVFALLPSVSGTVPLAAPINEAKGVGRGLSMIGLMVFYRIAISEPHNLGQLPIVY